MSSILFVCLGNICRSPAAEGVCRHLADNLFNYSELVVASAGLGDWHEGQLPDPRMRAAAKERGISLTTRAQQFELKFFEEFDYILCADHSIVNELYQFAESSSHKAKIHLITLHSRGYLNQEIPDPYYGNQADFNLVLDMCEDACEGLLEHLKGN